MPNYQQTIKSVEKGGITFEVKELLAPEEIFTRHNYETGQDEVDWVNIEFRSQYGYRHFKFQQNQLSCDTGKVNFIDGRSIEFKTDGELEKRIAEEPLRFGY